MRRRIAQLLAAATGIATLLLAVLFAFAQNQPHIGPETPNGRGAPSPQIPSQAATDDDRTPAEAGRIDRGRQVYREQSCAACHSIAGAGNRRNPLDGVGARLSRETIRRWILDPQSVDPAVRKPAYTNLSPEDLESLIAYLSTLVEPTPPPP